MKLIVISSSSPIENEVNIVTKLFEAGLETFHLRKHKLSTKKTREFISRIPEHFHNRIVIHSHHDLARRFNLKGIHLTKSHKKNNIRTWLSLKILKLKNPHIVTTTSYSSIGQLLETGGRYKYDYVFLSPIFDSLSSKFQGGFTAYSLKSAIEKTELKVIARGGIDISTIEKAHDIGFDGLAFYSSIWKKKDPLEEFNKAVEKFQELKIPIE
ncbi:MAG: thiamine phosphate synthase [Bacteroidota bacterium]